MQVTEDVDYESDVPAEEIQLGFLEAGANEALGSTNWTNWDGGKVGGKPIWLDPVHIPSPDELQCKNCDQPMTFLLQVDAKLIAKNTNCHRYTAHLMSQIAPSIEHCMYLYAIRRVVFRMEGNSLHRAKYSSCFNVCIM